MELKPGLRLKSAVCDAEVMVIKATEGEELTCGGIPLSTEAQSDKVAGDSDQMNECVIGKRTSMRQKRSNCCV